MEEIWSDIKEYESWYQISNKGRIRSVDRTVKCKDGSIRFYKGKVMTCVKDKDGYNCTGLSKNGIIKNYRVHRLVAQAFIPNPENKPQINHKDENPANNHVCNLEWVTNQENVNYGSHNEKQAKSLINHPILSNPVCQFDLNGNHIKTYPSAAQAERDLNVASTQIGMCCRHKYGYKTCGGFIWEFLNEVTNTNLDLTNH